MSEEEDDYMSDSFLLKCGDNRPGLVFSSKDAKAIQLEKRMKELNSKSKIKSKKVIEEENRCQGLLTTIPCHNKGFSLMQKMGYKPGMVLGKHGTGRAEPVPVELKSGRGGFGKESEARRKGMEMETLRSWLSVKRRRLEQGWKERFQQKISNKYASKNVEKDLHTSQAACFQLDREMGYTEPVSDFYWPENWKGELTLKENTDEIDLDEDDGEDDEISNDGDKLQAVTAHLRTTYFYCIWCGTKYDGDSDMQAHCPGDTAEDHE